MLSATGSHRASSVSPRSRCSGYAESGTHTDALVGLLFHPHSANLTGGINLNGWHSRSGVKLRLPQTREALLCSTKERSHAWRGYCANWCLGLFRFWRDAAYYHVPVKAGRGVSFMLVMTKRGRYTWYSRHWCRDPSVLNWHPRNCWRRTRSKTPLDQLRQR